MEKKWLGQTKCDFCGDDVKSHQIFFDAKTTCNGAWALMCGRCFVIHGLGRLGTGWGQMYDGKTLQRIGGGGDVRRTSAEND